MYICSINERFLTSHNFTKAMNKSNAVEIHDFKNGIREGRRAFFKAIAISKLPNSRRSLRIPAQSVQRLKWVFAEQVAWGNAIGQRVTNEMPHSCSVGGRVHQEMITIVHEALDA